MRVVNFLFEHFLFTFGALFIVGGIGIESIWVVWSGMAVFSLYILFFVVKNGKLKFPPNFIVYATVLVLFILNLFTTHNFDETLKYFFLFFGGALVWLFTYNIQGRKVMGKKFLWVVIFLGLFFGQYVIIEQIRDVDVVKSFAVTGFSGLNKNHHHIGDFFSVIAAISLYKFVTLKVSKMFWWILGLISVVFIVFSGSRSALLAFGLCALLIFKNLKSFKLSRGILYALFTLLILGMFYFAQSKSLLLSRPYFIQGIAGLVNNPFGVGMGNFKEISQGPENHLFGLNSFSIVAHNLPLEFLTGMGVLGLSFLYFFAKVVLQVLGSFESNPVFSLIFINLTVSFFFDFTYAIPTMLWLWFASLGLTQRQKK